MTVPSVPSTLIVCPVRMAAVARPVPTTAGIPYSRATIAACDITPPTSVTVALIFEKIGAQAGEVDAAHEDLAVAHVGDLVDRLDHACGAFDDAGRCSGAIQHRAALLLARPLLHARRW